MNKRILSSVLFMFVWLQGCVIPVMDEEPFKEKSVATLEPGQTDKADVLMALGEPAAVYDREKVFLYRDEQIHMVWFIIVGGSGGAGGLGGIVATRHFLVFEFDEQGQVARRTAVPYDTQHHVDAVGATSRTISGPKDRVEGTACTPSGLCIVDYAGMTVFANTKQDADAKTFKPSSRCAVYAYHDDPGQKIFKDRHVKQFKFDHQLAGMDPNGYNRFEVAPGHHEITVSSHLIGSATPNFKRVRFRCEAGDVRYVRFNIPSPFPILRIGQVAIWNFTGKLNYPIEAGMIEAEQGRAAILKKRLLLNPTVNGEKTMRW